MKRMLFAGPALLGPDSLPPGAGAVDGGTMTLVDATITVENGAITRVVTGADPAADVLVTAGVIAPGFVELQINGAYGADFTSDASSVVEASARLPATGITAFLPTIITSPFERYGDLLRGLRQAIREATGAHVLGAHLEGPYLSPRRPGAHDPALLRPVAVDEVVAWADPDVVRVVTLAPELPGAPDAIRALRGRGILVSAGHSAATYEEAMAAFEMGVAWGTHLFNAMSALGHRDPGLPGALLASDVPCGLIADGFHVHPGMVKVVYRCKGPRGLTLVTDAMEAMGMPPGTYRLGDRSVTVDGKTCRLADGTLAGSILTLDAAVRNMMAFAGCSLAEAVAMVSATPARVLGLARKGRIAPGCDADLVILDDALAVRQTWVRGGQVYNGS